MLANVSPGTNIENLNHKQQNIKKTLGLENGHVRKLTKRMWMFED